VTGDDNLDGKHDGKHDGKYDDNDVQVVEALRRRLRVTFDDVATLYDEVRPGPDHLMISADRRQRLDDGIAAMIDGEYGGQIAKQYLTVLYVAHRRSS
jgi:hypothetical protein